MTYIDEVEVRRPSRGTKVLGFGVAILLVLGSFWGIVWFIRSYVEPPRVMMPSPLALAARDSTPVVLPSPPQTKRAETVPAKAAAPAAAVAPAVADPTDRATTTGAIADRWAPLSLAATTPPQVSAPTREAVPARSALTAPSAQTAPSVQTATSAPMGPSTIAAAPATLATADPASPPTISAATSLSTHIAAPDPDVAEEVVESFIPAIRNPAPLPRRKPVMTASAAKRNVEPPLPRPRPDGPAPQSVFTAVPVADERFPTQY
jgi:Meckel syndrome type 1 protein